MVYSRSSGGRNAGTWIVSFVCSFVCCLREALIPSCPKKVAQLPGLRQQFPLVVEPRALAGGHFLNRWPDLTWITVTKTEILEVLEREKMYFHRLGPLDRVSYRTPMSVWVSVC